MSHPFLRTAAFLALSSLGVGCSGGGGATENVAPSVVASHALAAVVSIVIPARAPSAAARRPRYVSSGTQSFAIAAAGTTTAAATQIVDVASSACAAQSSGAVVCTIGYVAPSGASSLTIRAYAGANAGGALLTSGTVALPPPDPSGAPVVLAIAMGGVVANVALALGGTLTPGAAATIPVVVTARDASGATIVGADPYDAPIALAAASTAFAFSVSTVANPSTVVTLAYSGGIVTNPMLSATTSTGVSATVAAFGGATATASPTPTASPTATASPTPTPTATPVPTPSPTPTITVTIKGHRS